MEKNSLNKITEANDELETLRKAAYTIESDSKAFLESAKKLSEEGYKEAEKLIEFAKENWKTLLGATALLGIGGAVLTQSKSMKSAGNKIASRLGKTELGKTLTKDLAKAVTTIAKPKVKAAKKAVKTVSKKKVTAKIAAIKKNAKAKVASTSKRA